jgi:hypothetical protein
MALIPPHERFVIVSTNSEGSLLNDVHAFLSRHCRDFSQNRLDAMTEELLALIVARVLRNDIE